MEVEFKKTKYMRNNEAVVTYTQAERVINRFGGVTEMLEAMKLVVAKPPHYSTIYRWTMPREKGGTGGVIPLKMMPLILKAARVTGFLLTPEDFYPGEM